MTTLTMRPYIGEADLQPIADLLNACEVIDRLDEGSSVEELRDEFTAPGVDTARDLRLWYDADGLLIGFGQLIIPSEGDVADGFLWFKVHPDHRGAAFDDEIIAWGEQRMREVGQERDKPAVIRSGAREGNAERLTSLERNGFSVARYYWRMDRSLQDAIPEPQFPAGYRLDHLRGADDAEAWVAAFNQSFIDHYNHHPMTVAERAHWMTEWYYNPERDLVALAPDGSIAAFAWCSINPEENARSGRNEGWVNILGTRRGHRKIGLGRAMLLAGLHRLKADGMETAVLAVDGASPTGATRLYESVGFQKRFTSISCIKEL